MRTYSLDRAPGNSRLGVNFKRILTTFEYSPLKEQRILNGQTTISDIEVSYNAPSWDPNGVGKPLQGTLRNGAVHKFTYDDDQRMTSREEPFSALSTNQTKREVYSYASHESTDVPKLIDHRPRTTQVLVDGIPISTTYHAYFFNEEGEYVERMEEAVIPSSAYGSSDNRLTQTVYYAPGLPEAGRVKSKLNANGTLTQYAYQELEDNGLKIIEERRLTADGSLVEGKSRRVTSIKNSRGLTTQETTAVYTGGTWVDYEQVDFTYDKFRNQTTHTRTDLLSGQVRVLREQEWDAGKLIREVDEHGVVMTHKYNQLMNKIETRREAIPAQGDAPAQPEIITTYTGDFQMSTSKEPYWMRKVKTVTAGGITLTSEEIFDEERRLITSTDVNSYTTITSYSDDELITTRTLPNGGTVITTNAPDGKLISRTGTALIPQYMSYQPAGANGGIMTTTYTAVNGGPRYRQSTTDALDRVVLESRPAFNGQAHDTVYLYGLRVYCGPSQISSSGQPTQLYLYDALCDQIRSGLSVDDEALDLDSATDQVTDSDTLAVLESGKLWSVTTTSIYPEAGDATAKITNTSRRQIAGFTRDEYRVIEQIDIAGNLTTSITTLDPATNLQTTTTNVPGVQSAAVSTLHGRRKINTHEPGENAPTIYTHDALGRVIQAQEPRLSQPTVTTYLAGTNQVQSITDGEGNSTNYEYGVQGGAGAGQVITTTRANGTTQRSGYDLLDREVQSWGTANYPMSMGYNQYSEQTTLTTYRDTSGADLDTPSWPLGNETGDTTTWVYEASTGLLLQKQYADGTGPRYTYEIDGQLASRTWARGVVTDYQYDGFDRLTSTLYSNDPANTPNVTLTYDRIGRKVTCTQGAGASQNVTTYSYDPSTLLLSSETCSYFGGTLVRTIDRSYDTELRPAGLDLKNGATTEHSIGYSYTLEGQLKTVSSAAGTFTNEYEANNRALRNKLIGPVLESTWAYETNRNHLTNHSHQLRSNGTMIASHAYQIDNLGRRSSVTESGSAFLPGGHTINWIYNQRDEVIGADHSTDNTQDRGYDFDTIGNRKTVTDESGVSNYTANQLNQYTAAAGVSPVYDMDGNATKYPIPADVSNNATMEWDGENRLISLSKSTGETIYYTYDHQSRRIRKQSNAEDKVFLYDSWNLIAAYDSSTSFDPSDTTYYTWGMDQSGTMQGAGGVGGLLAVTENNQSYYPTCDGNGNIGTYVDGSGQVVAHYEFDAFGREVVFSGSMAPSFAHRFSSKYTDSESGLLYFGYRYYDPFTGRWSSRDPIEEEGGVNLYGFVGNDGVNDWDLFGLSSVKKAIKKVYSSAEKISSFSEEVYFHENCCPGGTATDVSVNINIDIELSAGASSTKIGGTFTLSNTLDKSVPNGKIWTISVKVKPSLRRGPNDLPVSIKILAGTSDSLKDC